MSKCMGKKKSHEWKNRIGGTRIKKYFEDRRVVRGGGQVVVIEEKS